MAGKLPQNRGPRSAAVGYGVRGTCFAVSLRFWHGWREHLARPDQRRLYRKSFLWGQSRLLFPGPNGAPLSRAALHNALRRLDLAGSPNSIGLITPERSEPLSSVGIVFK